MSSATITFLSYGNERFKQSIVRIADEAKRFPFNHIITFTENDLAQRFPAFWEKNREFIRLNPRGGGYYIWKSFLIQQVLSNMRDGEILVYVDAGCVLDVSRLTRFDEYIELLHNRQPVLTFDVGLPQRDWTKMDAAVALGCTDELERGQCITTSILLRKCSQTTALIDEWVAASAEYHLIDDSPSSAPNHPGFQEHRHDQSLWSCLVYKHGFHPIPDETWPVDRPNGPFLAARMRE